jgi:hypothetical protein
MFKPVSVHALPGFRLHVQYTDGVEGVVDLADLVGQGVFSLWSEPGAFEAVTIGSSGEIRWSDDVDLCPDAIYLEISGKSPRDVLPNLAKASVNA